MANKPTKKTIVIASGVFDLLHLGHVRFLEQAKATGGKDAKLIVVIARDSTVEKMKGRKPIMSETERQALVQSLKVVDESVLGYESLDIGEIIADIEPDVIALGYDQTQMEAQVKQYIDAHHLPVRVVRIGKFGENTLDSSTKIKQKIIDKLTR